MAPDDEDDISGMEGHAEFHTEREQLSARVAYLRSEIEKSKEGIEELRRKRRRAESNVEFYKTAKQNLDEAKTPLEIAEKSLVLVEKLRAEGSISEAQFSAKIDEIRNVINLYSNQMAARVWLMKAAAYFVVSLLIIGIIWLAWHTR